MIKAIDKETILGDSCPFDVSYTTDPEEVAKARARREQSERNCEWLGAHVSEVYRHRGKYICIAGQELFVADSAQQAVALAKKAYPEDQGCYLRHIPRDKLARIYAH